MRIVAITGGIGSGKTTVAKLYRSLGVKTVDADAISRELTAPGGDALPPLRRAFGDGVFAEDGTLDRAALGRLAFADPSALERLNAIMHPMITERVQARLAAYREAGESAVLLDVPLLFETGMDRLADAVICVTAPEEVRIRRVCDRDQLTRADAESRIRSQNPSALTESLADYVLTTNAPYALTRRRALALWRRILADGPRRTAAQRFPEI